MKHLLRNAVWALLPVVLFLAGATAYAGTITLHHPATVIIERLIIREPLTFCGEAVPLDNTDVKERFEREMLISLDNTDDILLWLKRA
ncbi:MAG: hypothetical protein R6W75_06250, partial [Smithellaceae bacterium]